MCRVAAQLPVVAGGFFASLVSACVIRCLVVGGAMVILAAADNFEARYCAI